MLDGPLFIHADPGHVSQVVVNLAANARDAMPDGGTLHISLGRAAEVEGGAGTPPGGAPAADPRVVFTGAFARLGVRDTGVGMDATTLESAFDPFFTTKETGGGTGLGLATVHGIVTQSGGLVRVTSNPGSGSQFAIYFPEASSPPDERKRGESIASVPQRRCSILLVEDDPSVRTATTGMLRSLGHRVIECSQPAEARAVWRASAAEIDVVVSDVILRGGTGPRLVAELLADGPLRVLFISGYLDDSLKDPLLKRTSFLPKPFSRRDLEAKLADVLAAPPTAAEE
jgi:CheY-like chemotaxis protein